MVVMAIVFFVRIYTHYSGMWLYISAIGRGATVSNFDFKPYTVDLVYQADLLTTGWSKVMTRIDDREFQKKIPKMISELTLFIGHKDLLSDF